MNTTQDPFEQYIKSLAAVLAKPLPGLAAQLRMSPAGRVDTNYESTPDYARRSAVLIFLYNGGAGRVFFPAIVRIANGSSHSGQIALPGGGAEPGESFPIETALREAREEVGLDSEFVNVLGTLTPLYIPVSNNSVTPVVAVSQHGTRPPLIRDAREVQEIIDLSVEALSIERSERLFDTPLGPVQAPCYLPVDGKGVQRCVWGATAMILAEFLACHEAAVSLA